MKIYTMVSKSHQYLSDEYFAKSVKEFEPDAEIIFEEQKQICKSGEYYSDGWKESMRQKVEIYEKAISLNEEYFIWSDVDIEFYKPFIETCIEELGEYDIAFQEGVGGEYCAGFFISKINDRTKKFFQLLKEKYDLYSCDQEAINRNIKHVKAKFLSHIFLNISFQHRHWNGQPFKIENELIMFHANYTVGLQNKIKLLNMAKKYNEKIKYNILEKENIEILEAYYGSVSDVTDILQKSKDKIHVTTAFLESDPMPGLFKYMYFFDKNNQLISPAIHEGSFIFFND